MGKIFLPLFGWINNPADPKPKPPKAQEIKKVEVKPSDILVVTCKDRLSCEGFKRLHDNVKSAFPENKVVILDQGFSLEIISKDT